MTVKNYMQGNDEAMTENMNASLSILHFNIGNAGFVEQNAIRGCLILTIIVG